VRRPAAPGAEAGNREKTRVRSIIRRLRALHPDARTALTHDTPLQLLVATILSAQCTDERVNKVTPPLFRRYGTAADFASADQGELEALIRSTGFFRAKARNIRRCCAEIVGKYGGKVPDTMEALVGLPGVGRKTANVVLGSAFGRAEGIVVDTHVRRLSRVLGLTRHNDPVKIENDLVRVVPGMDWIPFSHLLILHGRRVCRARKPDCASCPLTDLCPSSRM